MADNNNNNNDAPAAHQPPPAAAAANDSASDSASESGSSSSSTAPPSNPQPITNKQITARNPRSTTGTSGILYSTMLRVKDMEKASEFYGGELLGMRMIREEKTGVGMDGEEERGKVWKRWYGWGRESKGGLVELWCYEDGEGMLGDDGRYCNGNVEKGKGFGHIGIVVGDLEVVVGKLKEKGVVVRREAKKFEDVGCIAFVEDYDGYWVELIQRSEGEKEGYEKGVMGEEPLLAQTMIRVKDPLESIRFFQHLGMRMITRLDFERLKFSLFFMAFCDGEETMGTRMAYNAIQEKKAKWLWGFTRETIELTHNWGSEFEDGEVYHNGNSDPKGFGYISIGCDSVKKTMELMKMQGFEVVKKCQSGFVKGKTAIIKEPTGYWIKLVERPKPEDDVVETPDIAKLSLKDKNAGKKDKNVGKTNAE